MDASKKKPCGNMAQSKSVQRTGKNKPKDTTTKQPTKAEVGIEAFLRRGSLNTFEANREYNDTCLHSFVSFLNRRYGLNFTRKFEEVGAKRPVKRYTPTDITQMKRILNNLRVARGAEGVL